MVRTNTDNRRHVGAALVGLVLLLAGCGGNEQHPTTANPTTASISATATSAGSTTPIDKACLKGNEEAFHFRTSTGASLVGVALGNHGPGLVFAHQNGQDLCEWLSEARGFAKRGYRTEVFDFEGFGASQAGSGGVRYDTDVAAAAVQLRQRGAQRWC